MSARKPLPQVAPCPCPKHCKATVVRIGDGYYCRVISSCGFAGPIERANRASILSWNRRSVAKGWKDRSVAQGKIIDKLIKERDEAERRGAREMARWLNAHDWFLFGELALRAFEAVDSGEYKTADEVMRKRDPRTPARATLYQFEREAERRGAMAADLYVGAPLKLKGDNGRWFKASIGFPVEMTATDGTHNYPLRLDQEGDQWCFGCGEVLPTKTKKGARKR